MTASYANNRAEKRAARYDGHDRVTHRGASMRDLNLRRRRRRERNRLRRWVG